MTSKENNDKPYINWALILATGIFIPIASAIIPFILEKYDTNSSLEYVFDGPIEVNDNIAFTVQVLNSGKDVENNIEIFLPSKLEETPTVDLDSPYKIIEKNKTTVISVGNLRPNEKIEIGLLIKESYYSMYRYSLENLKITSEKSMASFSGVTKSTQELYVFGFWLAILMFILLVAGGIYEQFFESKKAKEIRLLKEMEKL